MRKFLLIIFVLPAIAFAPASQSSVQKQLKDYEVFEKVLVTKEGRLDLHQSSDSMYLYLSKLRSDLSEERDLIEQFKGYSKTIAKLGCGHTQIHPTQALLQEWVRQENSLPLDFVMQGKRLYTNKLRSDDYDVVNMKGSNGKRIKSIKGNYEILSLNHKTVPQMMNEISPYISSDENGIDFKYHQVGQLFDFYRHISDPYDADSIAVTYVKNSDTLSTYFKLGVAPINSINYRLQKAAAADAIIQKEMGSFNIESSDVGVFRFRSFTVCSGANYEQFLERSFRKIKSREIKKIVIDLRGNTGGVMQYALMSYFVGNDIDLGRYVVEKPKKGIETRHIKKRNSTYRRHKWMSRVQRFRIWTDSFEDGIMRSEPVDESLVYDGEVLVITDEGTFSSAAMLACHLKTLANAKIIGRPAGGSFYRGNAGTIIAVLPNSKFRLLVNPNTFYSHLESSTNPFEIKQPDVLLEPGYITPRKIEDYYIDAAIESFK
ncbi:MAG: S41 family peptidase [Crocinitomicaceae bacterium]|nr:S41 family peptidase [Crocinitomicaceae bacterium]